MFTSKSPRLLLDANLSRAEQLFELYFKYLHPHLPTLDVAHSSPSAVARRNNFLFNASECQHSSSADFSLLYCCSSLQPRLMGPPERVRRIRDGASSPGKERRGHSGTPHIFQLEVSFSTMPNADQ
jgi:hypothetical protein